jgi:glucose-1-phosphate thymidylyltransferase
VIEGVPSPVELALVDAIGPSPAPAEAGVGASRYTVPIANVPLISHVLAELTSAGITRIRILAGDGDALARALNGHLGDGPQVTIVEVAEGTGREAVLAELDDALASEPVLLHPGDALVGGSLHTMIDRHRSGDVDAVLPSEVSVATRHDPARGRLATNPVLLGPGARGLADELRRPGAENEDLFEVLLHSDRRLAVCELSGGWTYDSSTETLLAGNRRVLDALADGPVDPELQRDNQLHGRISVGHGAFISGCVIHGPTVIGARAVLEDSFIGPYTSIGDDAVLSGAELDNTMVLAGAEIRHPGQRIVSSIIGERARVTRSFELPRGLHLRLAHDSRVGLG